MENKKPAKLIDLMSEGKVQLVERREQGDDAPLKVMVRGEFGRWDKATANKRYYGKSVWESNIKRLREAIKAKKVIGSLDHPAEGRTSLQNVSHVITDLRVEKDGTVVGEAEILPTRIGKDLEAMLRAGVPIGISSRGYGSTKTNDKGEDVVQDDYKLQTFDFVAEPADGTAYPNVFFEGVEFDSSLTEAKKNTVKVPPEVLKKAEAAGAKAYEAGDKRVAGHNKTVAELIKDRTGAEHIPIMQAWLKGWDKANMAAPVPDEESVESLADKFAAKVQQAAQERADATPDALRKEFEETLLARLATLRDEIRKEVRDEFLQDPDVASAKSAVEQIARIVQDSGSLEGLVEARLLEKDTEIKALRRRVAEHELKIREQDDAIEKLTKAAKAAGYKYHLERLIGEDRDAGILREMVGDVTEYASTGAITDRIATVRQELDEQRQEEEARRERVQRRHAKLQEERTKLAKGLKQAMESNKTLALRLYAERQLRNHPHGPKIMSMLESVAIQSKEQIDKFIEDLREPEQPDMEAVRSRVRSRLQSGKEHDSEDRRPSRRVSYDYQGLGAPLTELRKLAGLRS